MTSAKAQGLIFVAAAIWGLSFVFTQEGLNYAPPALFLLLRFFGAFLITLAVFGRHIPSIDKSTLRQGLILGALFCGGYLFQTYSVKFTTIAHASFIAALTLPATPFVTWLVLRRKVAKWSAIGVAIALAGLLTLLNPFATWNDAGDFPRVLGLYLGDWIAIASVPLWAFYLNYMDVFTRDREGPGATGKMLLLQFTAAIPLLLVVWLVVESGLVMAPIEQLCPPGAPQTVVEVAGAPAGMAEEVAREAARSLAPPNPSVIWSRSLWICLAFNAFFASFVLTFLQTYAQRYTTPVKAMLMFQFEPIVATVAAIAFLGEAFSWLAALGAGIIILGVLASELGESVWARLTTNPNATAPTETALPPVSPTYTDAHKK